MLGRPPGVERDNPVRAARRLLGVAVRTGLLGEVAHPLGLLEWTVRQGLDVRTLHAVHASGHPDRLAVVDDRRTLTYAQMDAEVNRLANALADRFAVGRGTPVVMMMENRAEYLVAWFALFRLGAPSVHASWRMTAEELLFQVENSGARLVLASEATLAAAEEARARRPELRIEVVVAAEAAPEGVHRWAELVAAGRADFPRRGRLERLLARGSRNIVYTSGTTGRPKGTVRDLARYGLLELSRILERLPLRTGERHLLVSPLYHSGAQVITLLETALASTLFLRPHFEAEDALASLSRWNVNSAFLVPTMIRRILDLPEAAHRRHPTPDLRVLLSGAAPFPTALRERAMARFGEAAVYDFYGATELGWVTLVGGPEMRAHPGTVGRPLAGQEVRIEREDGGPAATGEVGRILVRNAQVMSGYLGERAPGAGRWATVDDLGWLDADGRLFVAGRARDMVISGGVNIYPAEIENVLQRHPSVKDAAVIGVPDEEWGERLVAVIVPEGGVVDAAELEAFLRRHVSSYKVPRRWEFVDALPHNQMGKVLKTELQARFG